MKTGLNINYTIYAVALSMILVGCSGGSQTGDDTPQFQSPSGRTINPGTSGNKTPTPPSTSNSNSTNQVEGDKEGEPSNQDILDAIMGQNEKFDELKAQNDASSKKLSKEINDVGDDASFAKWAALAAAIAGPATSIIGDVINHRNDDRNRDTILEDNKKTQGLAAVGNGISANNAATLGSIQTGQARFIDYTTKHNDEMDPAIRASARNSEQAANDPAELGLVVNSISNDLNDQGQQLNEMMTNMKSLQDAVNAVITNENGGPSVSINDGVDESKAALDTTSQSPPAQTQKMRD